MKKITLFTLVILCILETKAQEVSDTAQMSATLKTVIITDFKEQVTEVQRLEQVHGTFIVSGKKNEVITVADLNANLAEKTGRQIFAKVPGIFVYDMDGSGNQVNIATRGLDPHRSWEYNVRQNGVMMNSDIYGYPASHYSPPMEGVQKIELIHGTAGLQYGAQFGGMINYITKTGDTTKALSYEGNHSAGSYGLFSSYNAISGKVGKLSYYAYYHKRVSEGYRKNAHSDAEGQFASLTYRFTPSVSLKAELGRSTYTFRIPGPQTDAMFTNDPRQSTRSRNYFNPDIYLPSLTLDWKIDAKTKLNFISSAVLGSRSSVQFLAFANVADTINPATNQYKNRQVDIDNFHSYTFDLRLTREYNIMKLKNVLATGLRYVNNDLHRRQLGKGTTGSDFDLSITGDFGRDLHSKTQNLSFFLENMIEFTPQFSVSSGFRVEKGTTDMSGTISYLSSEKVPGQIIHSFPLFGISSQYKLDNQNRIYGGISQAYRPVIFSDVIPLSPLERTDPNLKDASGYNAEIGMSGKYKTWLQYDVSYFLLQYNNRIGSQALTENGQSYILKTNTGSSLTKGIEAYIELIPLSTTKSKLSFFTATSYFDAEYLKGSLIISNENKDIKGNKLETVPKWISRNGVQFRYRTFGATLQYSYVAESFSDALNTVKPSADGAKGIVPAYGVLDFNTSLRINQNYTFKLGVNNITNEQYFTKRPTGYPGVGVWSSDGRSIVGTIVIKY